jgi:hypothetical protein
MIVTVTNTSGAAMNGLASYDTSVVDGVQMGLAGHVAEGGQIENPLPYPFGHIAELADSSASVLPMHPRDWRYQHPNWDSLEPSIEWQGLIQNGSVTFAAATETDRVDAEELFFNAV